MLVILLVSLIQLQVRSVDAGAVLSFTRYSCDYPGHNGRLERQCVVSEPGWNVSWRIPDGRTIGHGYLAFSSLGDSFNGIYICTATKEGERQIQNRFRLSMIQAKPTLVLHFHIYPEELLVRGGVILRDCIASLPGWSIVWEILPDENAIVERETHSGGNLRLAISINSSPRKRYICTASKPGEDAVTLGFNIEF